MLRDVLIDRIKSFKGPIHIEMTTGKYPVWIKIVKLDFINSLLKTFPENETTYLAIDIDENNIASIIQDENDF